MKSRRPMGWVFVMLVLVMFSTLSLLAQDQNQDNAGVAQETKAKPTTLALRKIKTRTTVVIQVVILRRELRVLSTCPAKYRCSRAA